MRFFNVAVDHLKGWLHWQGFFFKFIYLCETNGRFKKMARAIEVALSAGLHYIYIPSLPTESQNARQKHLRGLDR